MAEDVTDNGVEDSVLIKQLQGGDLEALGDIYERYSHQVYKTALAVTHNTQVAEDILQEAFLRIYAYADKIDPARPLAPWLYRVTVNLCYTWTKRNQRYKISIESFIEQLMTSPKHAPETSAERSEIRETVQAAINTLPFGQKSVIVLHYLNGMNLAEIADILECPVGTVKSRLYHARQNLKDKLGKFNWVSDIAHGYT